MRLRHITFTGIDARTDLQELQAIQLQYPLAEFGVLTSYHWYENGNRYLDPQFLPNLYGRGLNLALHICGSAAHDAIDGFWNRINRHTVEYLYRGLFQRVQLNVSNRSDNPDRLASMPPNCRAEVIIQQRPGDAALFEHSLWVGRVNRPRNVSMLIDGSGGQGIDSPISIYQSVEKIGYAGGISPENVADKLTYLFENVRHGEFWIDMESGVRTDDWFNLDKVRRVLETCKPIINEYSREG
ncbi:MAG: hypothetical protein IJ767_04085 [Bacteroidaceae bacterium]|nr:hypothetical protein [Bacteroidaceae bacterium]